MHQLTVQDQTEVLDRDTHVKYQQDETKCHENSAKMLQQRNEIQEHGLQKINMQPIWSGRKPRVQRNSTSLLFHAVEELSINPVEIKTQCYD